MDLLFHLPKMTSDGISKSEMPVYTEDMSPDDNFASKGSGAGAAGWAPDKRARVEKSMKRKLDARCSLFVLIYVMNYLDRYVPRYRHSAILLQLADRASWLYVGTTLQLRSLEAWKTI